MDTDMKTIAKDYLDLVEKIAFRKDVVTKFIQVLEETTTWLTAPASPKRRFRHRCYPGGLVEHSVAVTEILLKLRECLCPNDVSEESCVIVGLFHDLGKVGAPGSPYYLENEGNLDEPYRYNPDLVHMDHATRSLYLVTQYVPLTDEEAQAIRYHDNQYIPENRTVSLKECPLLLLLQMADRWSLTIERGEVRENQTDAA